MGCCGGGHKHYQKMEEQEKIRMQKNKEQAEDIKAPNLMPILAFVLVAGIVFYFLR